jgi:hypothetical protein
MFLAFSGSLKPGDCSFGVIPPESYGITVWQCEWNECYASWLNEYSFDDTKATNTKATLVFFLVGILLLVIQYTLPKLPYHLITQSK